MRTKFSPFLENYSLPPGKTGNPTRERKVTLGLPDNGNVRAGVRRFPSNQGVGCRKENAPVRSKNNITDFSGGKCILELKLRRFIEKQVS